MGGDSQEPVADAAATLIAAIEAGEALIAERDQHGSGFITGGASESQPPWNEAAAWAVMVPHAGLRELEHQARSAVGSAVVRGGSDGNTYAAIDTLVSYARGAPRSQVMHWASEMNRWAQFVFSLPSVDTLPQWLIIRLPGGRRAPDCPFCGTGWLRVNKAYGVIACLFMRCPSRRNGTRMWASIGRDAGGQVRWTWTDGTTQP